MHAISSEYDAEDFQALKDSRIRATENGITIFFSYCHLSEYPLASLLHGDGCISIADMDIKPSALESMRYKNVSTFLGNITQVLGEKSQIQQVCSSVLATARAVGLAALILDCIRFATVFEKGEPEPRVTWKDIERLEGDAYSFVDVFASAGRAFISPRSVFDLRKTFKSDLVDLQLPEKRAVRNLADIYPSMLNRFS
jgi:hypothetical protein